MSEKYLLLILEDPDVQRDWPESRWREHDGHHRAFAEAVAAGGAKILASEPLDEAAVRFSPDPDGGKPLITDGPFPETKEIVLGFYLLEVADGEQARELAALCPTVGSLELRRAWPPDPAKDPTADVAG